MQTESSTNVLIDASRIVTEAFVQSGADVFIAYPITPSNLFYTYASQRFPQFMAAPDEITALQWMAGFSATGKLPVTSTAFPGLALMAESLNMAYMMELPMVIVITQRLGPSTGSATTGAQGDLKFLDGVISGGFPIPVLSPSNFTDAWNLAFEAVRIALEFRTPVVFLTSKEMVMTQKSFDINTLPEINKIERNPKVFEPPYKPYKAGHDRVPSFYPVGNEEYLVRLNASTHDEDGLIRKNNPQSLGNSIRLKEKMEYRIHEFTFMEYDRQEGATCILVSWGISAEAARDAVRKLRQDNQKISLLIAKTLLPVPPQIFEIIGNYSHIIFAEENLTGQYKEVLFGKRNVSNIKVATKFGSMLTPTDIEKVVNQMQ